MPGVEETVQKYAAEYGLDPRLIHAIIKRESSGNTWAIRYEPRFYSDYLDGKLQDELGGYWPKLCSATTEKGFVHALLV